MTTSAPIHMAGHLAPVPDEIDAVDLPVDGALPPELTGRYLRNGPNPLPGEPSPHWFLGHGMVHGIRLREGLAALQPKGDVGGKTNLSTQWRRRSGFGPGPDDQQSGAGLRHSLLLRRRVILALHVGHVLDEVTQARCGLKAEFAVKQRPIACELAHSLRQIALG